MRDIKFRAWDNVTKEMKQLVNITSYKDGSIGVDVGDYLSNLYTPREYFLMQYTGLKDKNGKEIYEGDILLCEKSLSRMPSRGTLRKKDPKQISAYILVEWENAGFHFNFVRPIDEHKQSYVEKSYTYAYIQFTIWDGQQKQPHVEIIGNIYENPTMLNSEPKDKQTIATQNPNQGTKADKQK